MKTKNATKAFEKAAEAQSSVRYDLCLFVAGTTPQSAAALRNIVAVCDELLGGRYDLSVVDVYQQPGRAKEEQIVVIPTLLRRGPRPARRLVGDLSDRAAVLRGLDLPTNPVPTP